VLGLIQLLWFQRDAFLAGGMKRLVPQEVETFFAM
jgi:hypothetical protein